MNEKTLNLLEFDTVRSTVAALSMSEEAAELILANKPCLDRDETEKLKSLVSSLAERMTNLGGEKRESLPDIGQLFAKLEVEGTMLEIDEAYAFGIFINRAETFRQWLLKPVSSNPGVKSFTPLEDSLAETARELPDCIDVSKDIFRILDYDGNLRDLSEFRDIRKRIKSIQKDIESAGSRYAKNDETRRMLQSDIPSQRDGRMVLAVKANFRGRIRGIVHEVSSTGQTIFLEPEEVVEKNNELLIEQRRLDAEIRRVLRELTVRIACKREEIKVFHNGILFLETIRARARYGFERNGNFVPDDTAKSSSGQEGKLVLLQALTSSKKNFVPHENLK